MLRVAGGAAGAGAGSTRAWGCVDIVVELEADALTSVVEIPISLRSITCPVPFFASTISLCGPYTVVWTGKTFWSFGTLPMSLPSTNTWKIGRSESFRSPGAIEVPVGTFGTDSTTLKSGPWMTAPSTGSMT